MDADAQTRGPDERGEAPEGAVIVTCHETRPGQAVFTERANCDGWIATDLLVDLEP